MYTIPYAPIYWQDDTPGHRDYQDHYFSRHDGLTESRYIFLACNDLPTRWRPGKHFVIGETGFGTGLNFLATLDLWRQHAPPGAVLHYLSLDRFLVHPRDLEQILGHWPALQDLTRDLQRAWPEPVSGLHRREFLNGSCVLTLGLGEAADVLRQFDGTVDAWFLDGFAPGRNPDMWRPEVFANLARLSRRGTTATSFTVAGVVRRGLEEVGFSLRKIPGYASKREMLRADFNADPARTPHTSPWFQPPPARPGARAIVIGAGIAGATVAAELVARGHDTVIVDQGPGPGSGASGNPAGVLLPRLTADMSPDGRFYLSAFLHAVWALSRLQAEFPQLPWRQTGVLHQLPPARRQALLQLALPPSVLVPEQDGVAYPLAGWLQPAEVCRQLLQRAVRHGPGQLDCRWRTRATTVQRGDDGWRVQTAGRDHLAAELLILAGGWELAGHPLLADMPLQCSRGQVTLITGAGLPDRPVCGDHYVTPAGLGEHCIGAGYDTDISDLSLREAEQQQNLAALTRLCGEQTAAHLLGGRVGIRATVPDHLPLVGPVPEPGYYREHYADLRHGRAEHRYPPARYQEGLFISAGHGSRGLTSAFLSAALLADLVDGTPLPLPPWLAQALHPARFLVRGLKRGTLLQ